MDGITMFLCGWQVAIYRPLTGKVQTPDQAGTEKPCFSVRFGTELVFASEENYML